jgi:hypothetical protein
MAHSEQSFGKKLRNAQDMITFVQGFTNYTPPRTQETLVAMQTLLTSVISANATEATNRQQYRAAVDARTTAFSKGMNSIPKLLVAIRAAVDAQYGKNSAESASIQSILRTIRAGKSVQAPAKTEGEEAAQAVSRSQRSYGSQTQLFNNLVNTLNQLPGYNPSNPAIKIAALQTFVTQLTTLNNAVAQKFAALQSARSNRSVLYTDLNDRTQRMKAYVKSQYGQVSNEYKLIKGISA